MAELTEDELVKGLQQMQINLLKQEIEDIEFYIVSIQSLFPLTNYNDHAEQELKYCQMRKEVIDSQLLELKSKGLI